MTLSNYIDNYYVRNLREDTRYPALSGATEADVCIVGGGLAGINTALGLLERGKSVVVVEAKRIGWGASGRNAGFVAKGYSAGEGSLADKLGLEHARRLVTLTKNARKLIRQRIAQYDIDCGPVIDGVLTAWWSDDPEAARPAFRLLRELRDRIAPQLGLALHDLSMGMTGDLEVAIAEGATILRVGSALFGRRTAPDAVEKT